MNEGQQEPLEILEAEPEAAAEVTFGAVALSAGMLFVLAWIATKVERSTTLRFDEAIRNFVHGFASPKFTMVMQAFSVIGGQVLTVLALVVPALLWWRGKRRASIWLVATMLGALVLDLAMKYSFHRQRPIPYFGTVPHTYSFPSGHSLFSFCFYGSLAGFLANRTRSRFLRAGIYVCAALLIICIGMSRIYLGVHYPTDVIAGYLSAAIWVSVVVMLDHWRQRKRSVTLADSSSKPV